MIPRIYGLPKLHKENVPLRPIVSTINSPPYKLSKYLIQILTHLTNNSNYNIKNTHTFKNYIENITLKKDDKLHSFDVVSLFTNIPLEVALQEINRRWEEIKNHTKITKNLFIDLLNFCINENNFFSYNNKIYKQNRGLAMGNPLSPILADIVLEKLLSTQLSELTQQPTFIKKYVDDLIFAIPDSEVENMYDKFQSFNSSIKFTIEHETSNTITFLDIRLHRNNGKIITNWFSKSTASQRLLNYLSAHPRQMKINVARSFVNKIFDLSNPIFWNNNKTIIRHILQKNNYPLYLINSLINKRVYQNNKNSHPPDNNHSAQIIEQNVNKIEITTTFKSISYIPKISDKIINTIKKRNENKHIKITNKIPTTTSSIFSTLKDKIDKLKKQDTIYSIKCKTCPNKNYIGMSSQPLEKRIKQHMNNCKNKNKFPRVSGLVFHSHETGHEFDFENVEILNQEQNWFKRKTIEGAYIWMEGDHSCNFRSDLQQVNPVYSNLLKSLKDNNFK